MACSKIVAAARLGRLAPASQERRVGTVVPNTSAACSCVLSVEPVPKQRLAPNVFTHVVTSGLICSTQLVFHATQMYNESVDADNPGQELSRVLVMVEGENDGADARRDKEGPENLQEDFKEAQ